MSQPHPTSPEASTPISAIATLSPHRTQKVRLRFTKADDVRWLSHHDLMRCAERLCRRAELPLDRTKGFHPAPRIVFALSLQLGVQGEREVLELEFTEPLDPADVFARVQQQAPNGLRFTQCDAIPLKANAVPRRAEYRFPIPAERADATQHACEELFAQPQVWLLKTHPKPRQVNVRPYIRALRVERSPCPELVLDLWVTGQGTARAEDLIRRLQLEDVIQSGAILRRTELELHDEVIAPKDHPPEGAPETRPAAMTELPPPGEPDHPARPTWGLSPSGPVVE